MNIQEVEVEKIRPYERNAKTHTGRQVEQIANSIRQFGFRQPIVLDKNGVIIIGHGRYQAAMQLKMKTVPCVRAEDLTEEQVAALRLADTSEAFRVVAFSKAPVIPIEVVVWLISAILVLGSLVITLMVPPMALEP